MNANVLLRTDSFVSLCHSQPMARNPSCRVVEAQRLNGDLVVTFNDNRCGFYPAHMLYEMLSAVEITDTYESKAEEFARLPTENPGRPLAESGD